jgi:hypothetical protein
LHRASQLPSELLGGGPAPTGGKKGTYTPQVEAFAQELAQTSLAHVRVLRDILGDQAAPIPAINLDTAWQQWANAALNTQLQPAFDPYGAWARLQARIETAAPDAIIMPHRLAANDLFFSLAVNQLEGLSVTAFRGLSSLVQNSEYASIFSGILGAEAYYDGAIRWRLSDRLAVVTPWQQPLWRVVNAFSQLRIKLSQQMQGQQGQQQRSGVSQQAGQQQAGVSQQQQAGQAGVSQQAGGQMGQQQQMGQSKFDTGILQPVDQSSLAQAPNPRTFAGGNALQFAAVDPQTGLVFARTPQQVLAVLYGSGDASKPGMFYPQGINGFKA